MARTPHQISAVDVGCVVEVEVKADYNGNWKPARLVVLRTRPGYVHGLIAGEPVILSKDDIRRVQS